ncbi:MAG: hypothetical protein FWG53_11510 [Clostridiales bacterium]|nr:hypothetical protein [Clostridiales bacterium]
MQFQSGTIRQQTQVLQLKRQWAMQGKQLEDHSLMEQMSKARHEQKMSSIYNMLNAGKRLTPSEKEYLRGHEPALYQKVIMIENERDSFKRELRRCKTKDEADRLRYTKYLQLAGEVTSVSIITMSAGATQVETEYVGFRAAALRETFLEFVSEGKYFKLPSKKKP